MTEKKTEVVGFIFARGGSKSIPRKNLALLGGKPLLHHAQEGGGTANPLRGLGQTSRRKAMGRNQREEEKEEMKPTLFFPPAMASHRLLAGSD